MVLKCETQDEASMMQLGMTLASSPCQGAVVFLHGPLGAGKTTLARGFLRGLGYEGKVKSPTYTLVESYDLATFSVFHFDFYRLSDPLELDFIGISDFFTEKSICLVEWPEYGLTMLPTADLVCEIEIREERRHLTFTANTSLGTDILKRIKT